MKTFYVNFVKTISAYKVVNAETEVEARKKAEKSSDEPVMFDDGQNTEWDFESVEEVGKK